METDLFDDDESTETQATTEDSSVIRDLRRISKTQEKELKELRSFREQVEQERAQAATAAVFTEVGLDPARASWFKADNPDQEPTRDAVRDWAAAAGFIQAPESEQQGFSPTVVGEGTVDAGVIDGDRAMELLAAGQFEKLEQEFSKGRLNLAKLPGNLE